MAYVANVIVTHEDTASEVIDTVNGGDTQALDAAQQILECY